MKNTTFKLFLKITLINSLFVGLVVMQGCANISKITESKITFKQTRCSIDNSGLENAVLVAKTKLSSGDCPNAESLFTTLYAFAKIDPDINNRDIMADYLDWAAKRGHMPRETAKYLFNRYFHTTFVSLPDRYSICATIDAMPTIMKDMRRELATKEDAYLNVLHDKTGYQQVYQQYQDLSLILEATKLACQNQIATR